MTANGFKEMLRYFRLREGMTQSELGAALGCGKSRISMYEMGQRKPTPDVLETIADFFNVNVDLLLGRASDKMVPVLGHIACGEPITAEQNIEEYINLPTGIRADYALTCRGESMVGAGIQDGDTVFIRSQPIVDNGQIAAVRVGEDATMKRFKRTDNGIILMPENPECDPIIYDPDGCQDVEILGLAVAYLHKLV